MLMLTNMMTLTMKSGHENYDAKYAGRVNLTFSGPMGEMIYACQGQGGITENHCI